MLSVSLWFQSLILFACLDISHLVCSIDDQYDVGCNYLFITVDILLISDLNYYR